LTVLGAIGTCLFGVTGWAFERHFLVAMQQSHEAPAKPRAQRAGAQGLRAQFSRRLFPTILIKELALLRRSPQIISTLVLRLVYLAPLMLVVWREQTVLTPALAFVGVFMTTQMTGDLAWLVISGEDSPDLMAVAPIARGTIARAKCAAAVAMAWVVLLPLTLLLAWKVPAVVPVVVPLALIGASLAALIQLWLERPTPRQKFGRRAHGASIAANLLVMLTALVLGGVASALGWWITS